MLGLSPVYQARVMFTKILERYKEGLEKLKSEGAPLSQIAYVEKCIANIENLPIMKEKPD